MRHFILSLPLRLQSVFIVLLTVLMAFLIAHLLRMFFDVHQLEANIDLISASYQVLGTIYAILLTFTLWGVWQNFSSANDSVQEEAYTLLDLVHILEASAAIDKKTVRTTALKYTEQVLNNEWVKLKCVTTDLINLSEPEHCASSAMIHLIQSIQPSSEREGILYGQTLTLLASWMDARRKRLLIARGNSAKALWPLLLTGAFVLFGFHGLFVATTSQIWTVVLLGVSFVIGLTFYLIFTLDCPFAGFPCIDSEPFKLAKNILNLANA